MYQPNDVSWQRLPTRMAEGTVRATADRIAEHAERHGLRDVEVILHGGEPLLAGREYIAGLVDQVRRRMPADLRISWGVQTNGVLIDDEWMRTLAELGIAVSVSIDGSAAQHDRQRKDRAGAATHARVAEALRLLMRPEYARVYSGLLAVVDLRNDPVEVYESLLGFAPPQIDFLLPHGNWSSRPAGLDENGATPYGDWLSTAFDRWFGAERQETVVRLFQDTVVLLLGGPGTTSHIGLSPIGFVVVNTDGQFEQVDSLRTARPDEPRTGLNVFDHTLDDVLLHPAVRHRQSRQAALGPECQQCDIVSTCGGGNYVHRYRHGAGFRNRSVYCADLQRYIGHVGAAVRAALA